MMSTENEGCPKCGCPEVVEVNRRRLRDDAPDIVTWKCSLCRKTYRVKEKESDDDGD